MSSTATPILQGTKFLLKQLEENPVALRQVKTNNKEYISLKDAIAKEGVILPIAVTPCFSGDGKTPRYTEDGLPMYRIIDGLHRFTASKELGLDDISVVVLSADDARVEKLQIMANAQKVRTRPSELAAHLNRIMGRDSTRTLAELGSELGFSAEYLGKILSISEIESKEIQELINTGKITVSNAADLAKLPAEEQENFKKDAVDDPAIVFGPKVAARIKAIKEDRRKGRDPNATVGFSYEPHLRSKVEVCEELSHGAPTLMALLKAAGASSPEQVVAFTLKWVTKQDAQSVDAAKAKWEARKAEREADALKRKAERDADRAKESAAKVAAVPA